MKRCSVFGVQYRDQNINNRNRILITVCDENQISKKIQKHQVGEGSVNLRVGGAVTANQDGDYRKLSVKDSRVAEGWLAGRRLLTQLWCSVDIT